MTRTGFPTTARLLLRPVVEADEELLAGLDSDPAVMRFITGGAATPPRVIRQEVLPRMLRRYEMCGGGPGYWVAEERAGGEFLGWFELRPSLGDDGRELPVAELGYRLRRPAWGRGYATEGARALVGKAFTEFGLERVHAETMTVNHGSRRVMEKAGLVYAGTFHGKWPEYAEGAEHGDVRYELSRAEWARSAAGAGCPAGGTEA